MTMVREQHLALVYRYEYYYSPKYFIRIPIQNEGSKHVDEIMADINMMMLKYHLEVLDV